MNIHVSSSHLSLALGWRLSLPLLQKSNCIIETIPAAQGGTERGRGGNREDMVSVSNWAVWCLWPGRRVSGSLDMFMNHLLSLRLVGVRPGTVLFLVSALLVGFGSG